ncbi:MAG: hypothetical protein H5T78_07365 [Nocardia sp.]|nr:hypothetical protein [Nocardia sp.]
MVYRHYGVESALDYTSMRDGESTAMFLAVVDAQGAVVGGLRAQGPHALVDEVDGLGPWIGTEGEAALRSEIARCIADGIVEVKAVWSDRTDPRRSEIGALLARGIVHVARQLEARHAFVTTAIRGVERYESSGARQLTGIPGVVYPDERYVTVPLAWDLADQSTATPRQRRLIAGERQQLESGADSSVSDPGGAVSA